MNNNENKMKIHKIVGYIEHRNDFHFDTYEVLEELDRILAFYGIVEPLSSAEYLLLQHELYMLAERFEVAEAAWKTYRDEERQLACL